MASSALTARSVPVIAASSPALAATSCTTAMTSPAVDPTMGVRETSTGNSAPSARIPMSPLRELMARGVGEAV